MSVSSVIPPFNLLLNSISNDLSPQNLQSLVHICESFIPESKREEIKNGIDVFRILKQQNVISDDPIKVQNLEKIMKEMRPKRRDIIKKVRRFIRTNYDPGYDFESSGESFGAYCEPSAILVGNQHQQPPLNRYDSSELDSHSGQRNPSDEIRTSSTENHCSMDCCCWGCKCYARRIPSCVLLLLTGIMAILTFLSSMLWFGKIPDNMYRKLGENASKAGGYAVGCLGLATIVFLSWWIYRKVRGNGNNGQIPYQSLTNDIISPDQINDCGSTLAVKGPAIPPPSVKLPTKRKKRTRPIGSVTAGSSLDTAASASVLDREPTRPRPHRSSTTEDGGLQTDGACGSEETDYFIQSRESLFPAVDTDFSCSDEPTVPPFTAE